jgi:3-oxoacyl-(acyl-carrier-protein) synthase
MGRSQDLSASNILGLQTIWNKVRMSLKVVITGMRQFHLGIGVKALMEGLYSGHSAVISQKSEWEEQVKDLNCWVGAPVKEPLPSKSIPRQYRRTMGPTAIMSLLAANEAIGDAGISESILTSGRTGVSFSSRPVTPIF